MYTCNVKYYVFSRAVQRRPGARDWRTRRAADVSHHALRRRALSTRADRARRADGRRERRRQRHRVASRWLPGVF